MAHTRHLLRDFGTQIFTDICLQTSHICVCVCSFEDDDKIIGSEQYVYRLPSSWNGAGGTVVALNGNDPWGGLDSGSGKYFLSIQGSGAYVEQTVNNLVPGATYEMHFLAAERPDYGGDEKLKVTVDGAEIWESTHPAEQFARYSAVFAATNTYATIRFENDSPGGDRSIFIDSVAVVQCADCALVHPDTLVR
jgi:hypothetical protein